MEEVWYVSYQTWTSQLKTDREKMLRATFIPWQLFIKSQNTLRNCSSRSVRESRDSYLFDNLRSQKHWKGELSIRCWEDSDQWTTVIDTNANSWTVEHYHIRNEQWSSWKECYRLLVRVSKPKRSHKILGLQKQQMGINVSWCLVSRSVLSLPPQKVASN